MFLSGNAREFRGCFTCSAQDHARAQKSLTSLIAGIGLLGSDKTCVGMVKMRLPLATALACSSVILSASAEEPFFEFSSGIKAYDDAYKLAMVEVEANIEKGVFIAGAGWKQLWTRDTSYAVELGAGLVNPEISKESLKKSIEVDKEFGDVWLQDECGHFGKWPNLSDAIVGVRGAWSLYLTTGDEEWLAWTYDITTSSLARAERDVYDSSSGLFLGCSSFMESNSGYPEKYRLNGKLVGKTKALSTNMLHYAGYKLGAKMAELLGKPETEVMELYKRAEKLRDAIRSRLWLSKQGYYSYIEDEDDKLLQQMEGLGESLVLLGPDFEIDSERVNSIFANVHRTGHGLPCLWPQFNNTNIGIYDYYHNGRIWPFVQGYWALAAARHNQVSLFAEEFKNIVWLSQQGKTFAEFYELDGKFSKQRTRQLWSDTGLLSMVYYGLFGMTFLPHGLAFAPMKPASMFAEKITLRGIRYREMILNIHVSGSGTQIATFSVDGKNSRESFVQGDLTGTHTISITLFETAADYVTETLDKFPIDTEKRTRVVFAAFGMATLLGLLAAKGPLRRFFRKRLGDERSM